MGGGGILTVETDTATRPRCTRLHRHGRAVLIALTVLLVALLLVLVVMGWIGSERAIHPKRTTPKHSLSDYSFARITQDVRFPSGDGTPLAGWFVPGGGAGLLPTVILLHGYGPARQELLPHADYLHRAGYNVLLFDFRGRGQSGGGEVTIGAREPLDVRGAIEYVLTRPDVDPAHIALQGVSLGASSGILEMQHDSRVAAIVSESAFTDLDGVIARSFENFIGLPPFPFAPVTVLITELRLRANASDIRPLDAIRKIGSRPALFIDDGRDTDIPAHSGQRLYAAAPGPKELWLIPNATHAGGYAALPQEYQRRVLAFYLQYLHG